MTKRLYFTCPIKSLYMHVYFGVKFSTEVIIEADLNDENTVKNMTPEITKIYVAAESESIFEQKKGDIGIWQEYDYIAIAKAQEFEDFEENNGTVSPSHHWKIIMRNNKQFFMPEVENER